MLTVKAVSNYTATAPDHVDVCQGEVFYVLSMTADRRKYFLSSSARVPFARGARCGFAPLPLFAVIGDTLPANLRPKEQTMISRRTSPSVSDKASPKRARIEMKGIAGGDDKQSGMKGNLAAAAWSVLNGFRGRKTTEISHNPSSFTVASESKSRSLAAMAATPLPQIKSVTIAAYKRSEHGIEFTIRFDLPEGKDMTVHRYMSDFEAMRASIPSDQSAHLPVFRSIAVDEERSVLRARGKQLNHYLRTVLHLHNRLIAQGDAGLPICDFLYRPAKPVAAAVICSTGSGSVRRTHSVTTRHVVNMVASPMLSDLSPESSGRPLNAPEMYPATDSGYSSKAGSRKNSHHDVAKNLPPAIDAANLVSKLSKLATGGRR